MTSEAVTQTVNPRDLTVEDLKAWNSEVGSGPSHLPPAIDRTFSDKHFDRLRQCDVSELQADVEKASDYELLGKLGEGGMGDVFTARQGSLDRLLALKLIKPLSGRRRAQLMRTGKLQTVEEERRQQFLSEAIVTSDLDHPNIVPIHDVALTSRGDLFYSMKRVDGTPWSDVIKQKSRDENLEILLKAADAVGFAHTRGVVHRDLKPENIMLGDFGVVMVMDWGLALPTSQYEKQDSIFATSGLGGTPAFMAPELATGPLKKIGPAADIYLLGATLYMIITGVAPHQAKNVTACLRAVKLNKIRPVPEEQRGELLDIALKAMATDPKDRYPDVKSFQAAIRDYRAHAESISLATRASEDLERGSRNRSYADLSRAAFRFEESIKSWPGNQRAADGLAETIKIHAAAALANGDFDLGLSLLSESEPEHQTLIAQLRSAQQERDSRQSRLKVMRSIAAALIAFIVIGGSVALVIINNARESAEKARDSEKTAKLAALASAEQERQARREADAARLQVEAANEEVRLALAGEQQAKQDALDAADAERDAKLAAQQSAAQEAAAKLEEERQRLAAEQARDDARMAQADAENQRRRAEQERSRAQYEQYVSMIGLAKARLERNESDGARQILETIRNTPEFQVQTERWEWRWLWHQANQSHSDQSTGQPVIDLTVSPDGSHAFAVLADGTVRRSQIAEDGRLLEPNAFAASAMASDGATCVAVSTDKRTVAIGTRSGAVVLVDENGSAIRSIPLHLDRVNDVCFSRDGLLLSASTDRTVRIWDEKLGREMTAASAAHHISPVQQIAVAGDRNELVFAAAISDEITGQVAIWFASQDGDKLQLKQTGTMSSHRDPITALAITTDGGKVASGDIAGNVWLWDPTQVAPVDYGARIRDAISNLDSASPARRTMDPLPLLELTDRDTQRFVSTVAARELTAHQDVIRSLQFSGDSASLVSASDDYTIRLWDATSGQLQKTLKGHGGWVVAADFAGGDSNRIVSGSNDATIRSWIPDRYLGATVVHRVADSPSLRQTQAHQDEIWSVGFSSDGSRVVSASHDHTARVMEIDPATLAFREVIRLQDEVLEEGTSFVAMSLQVHHPSQRLFIGSADATIRIWDLQHGTQVQQVRGTGINTSFAVSRDGRYLLSGSSTPDVKALLWQLDPAGDTPPRIVHRMAEHDQAVTAFAISPDSRTLFTGDRSGFGILWDRNSGRVIGDPVENVRGSRINAASFSTDGTQLMIGADDEQLTIIDIASRQSVERLNHDGLVTQLAVADSSRLVVTVSESDSVEQRTSSAIVWDLDTGRQLLLDRVIESLAGNAESFSGQRITSARIDDESGAIAVSRSATDQTASALKWFSLASVREQMVKGPTESSAGMATADQVFELPEILDSAQAILPMPGEQLLTMNKNGGFLWDIESQRLLKSFRAHAELTEACFSPDDRFVATASRSVKIWDASTGKALAKLESPRPIRTVQFAPQPIGNHTAVLATGGDDGVIRMWSWNEHKRSIKLIRELTPVKLIREQSEQWPATDRPMVRRIRFSPSAEHLIAVGDRGLAQILSTDGSADAIVVPMPTVDLTCAAFSGDGAFFAVGGADKKVRVWAFDGDSVNDPIELIGHADVIHDVSLLGHDPSGLRVITASADDTARIWDPRLDRDPDERSGGREILSLRQHVGDITSVDVTSDGSLLMTSGRDGNVILWPAQPPPENLFETP